MTIWQRIITRLTLGRSDVATTTTEKKTKGTRKTGPSCDSSTTQTLSTEGTGTCCQTTVRELAYSKWEDAGRPEGDGVEYWVEAEKEVQETLTQ